MSAAAPGLQALVTVEATPGGAQLRAVGDDGQHVTLWLDDASALTLADELTIACQRPLQAAGPWRP